MKLMHCIFTVTNATARFEVEIKNATNPGNSTKMQQAMHTKMSI